MVCFQSILCGEASSKRLPGIIPAGYASHTGYQYDSISRVAGHRELAPPSKFSKLGGFSNSVLITSGILHPQKFVASYPCGRFLALVVAQHAARLLPNYAIGLFTGIPLNGTAPAPRSLTHPGQSQQ